MTKEKLMEWGLTEEQANKVMEVFKYAQNLGANLDRDEEQGPVYLQSYSEQGKSSC